MARYFLDIEGLEYFYKRMKEYVDIKIDLNTKKYTNCPNCGAVITGIKCEYCGTNFGTLYHN